MGRVVKKIYISGPMTGRPNYNHPAFNAEAARLRALGYEVVNPAEINASINLTWHECLRRDLQEMLSCDAVALIDGWHDSIGAHLELHVAHRVGLKIMSAEEIAGGVKTNDN